MDNQDNSTIGETDLQEIVDITSQRKNVILDSQILTSLMGCPRLTDFRFNHNLMSLGGKSNSLEVGSIVHTFLEHYYKKIKEGFKKSEAEGYGWVAAQLYIQGCPGCSGFNPTSEIPKPVCNHKPDEYPGLTNTPKDSEGYIIGWAWALETIQQYLDYYKNDSWTILEIENVRSKIIYQDDELRILWKAKLDLLVQPINATPHPVDHKTMKQNRSTLSLNNQFMGQCVNTDSRSVIINKIGFQKTLKPADKFKKDVISYDYNRLIEWQSEIVPYYAKLLLMYAESGYYPPQLTHCETKYGLCAFTEVCGSNPDMREMEIKRLFKVGPAWNPTNDEGE